MESPMPKRKTEVIESFGERLARLRKDAGFTQAEFADVVGITQRMRDGALACLSKGEGEIAALLVKGGSITH